MNKERFPLVAGSLGILLLLIGIFGGAIEGRFGPLFFTLALVGLALFLIFLYLAGTSVRVWMNRRSTRYGTNLAIMVLVAFAVAIFIETLSYSHYKQFDVTGDRLNSLSAQTIQILKGLEKGDEKIQVVAFVRDSDRKGYQDLLDLYTYITDRFQYEMVDLDKNPLLAKKFDVRAYGTLVFESGENRQKVELATEQNMANAILKVTRTAKKIVYFLKGHGEGDISSTEKDGFSQAKRAIELENMVAKDLVLLRANAVPEGCLRRRPCRTTKGHHRSGAEDVGRLCPQTLGKPFPAHRPADGFQAGGFPEDLRNRSLRRHHCGPAEPVVRSQ